MIHYQSVPTLVCVICLLILMSNGLPQVKVIENERVSPNRHLDADPNTNPSISKFQQLSSRLKRSSENIVKECIFMTSDDGEFYCKASGEEGTACGIYIIAEPDQKVEVRFNYFDVPCANGGLVAFVDGWELNGELFPSPRDHSLHKERRFREFCDEKKMKHAFVSSSNVALIQYRMPFKGSGFTITVRFLRNLRPCNVLLQAPEMVYTLKNYEKRSNCSVSTLFPSAVKLEAINVGVVRADARSTELETGTIHKCQKRGLDDYVQIGGSLGLDNANILLADSVCGLNSKQARFEDTIACGTTTIRLVSSGAFDNSVTIRLRQLNEEDMNNFMTVVCPMEEVLE